MNRYELLELEEKLISAFSSIIQSDSHAIYFPKDDKPDKPIWLKDEAKLLLPLHADDVLLGVLMFRNVKNPDTITTLFPYLPNIASICLQNVELYRIARLDAQTGLATRTVFMDYLTAATEELKEQFAMAAKVGTLANSVGMSGFGVGVVRFGGLSEVTRAMGHIFVEKMLEAQAKNLKSVLPEQVMAARTSEYEFAFMLRGPGHNIKQKTIEVLHRLSEFTMPSPRTGHPVKVLLSGGCSVYPNDLDGSHRDDVMEPAVALLKKASLAAHAAKYLPSTERVLSFSYLLREGGKISRVLPVSTVEISLGSNDNVRAGMHFSIWQNAIDGGTSPAYKGEIVVTDVNETQSKAEILRLGDERIPISRGDVLKLLPDARTSENIVIVTGFDKSAILRHADFLAKLPSITENLTSFALVMLRIPNSDPDEEDPAMINATLRICDEHHSDSTLAGRFASNIIVFFHPTGNSDQLITLYSDICNDLANLPGSSGMIYGAGIAVWPYMHYHPGDIMECARKALDYALLLPEPRVGVFGSLAINISADRHHCKGDLFGAIEEYRLAILADPQNALAWNSIGVCMESLGRGEEARTHFKRAAELAPNDVEIAYNLAGSYQRLSDLEAAKLEFARCLKLDPNHLFAKIRLAQIDEEAGNMDAARRQYQEAMDSSPDNAAPYRCLAHLAIKEGKSEEARELLHKALLKNPLDSESLSMMAKLYLDGGEDVELAEYLARQSVSIRPKRKAGWIIFAKALEVAGKSKEAKDAWLTAESL